jgi:hypothetical protein
MSCFEKSLFKRNQALANPQTMAAACAKLGFTCRSFAYGVYIYGEDDQLLMVVDMGHIYFNNETDRALIAELEHEAAQLVAAFWDDRRLQYLSSHYEAYHEQRRWAAQRAEEEQKRQRETRLRQLNVEYARQGIIQSFEAKGFFHQADYNFRPSGNAVDRFFMCAYTRLDELPEDRQTFIEFTVMNDGSIVSDSNYIPSDVHEKADEAMENLENILGNVRREGIEIRRKQIPYQYETKSYCSIHQKATRDVFEYA